MLFVLLLLTGLPLMVFYIPSTREAYQSIKDIEHVVSFGWWLRAAHRIAAHLMVIAVTLHMARVFLTGAYRNDGEREQHREWNWVIGVALLAGTVLLSFTGYLLPWDQLALLGRHGEHEHRRVGSRGRGAAARTAALAGVRLARRR